MDIGVGRRGSVPVLPSDQPQVQNLQQRRGSTGLLLERNPQSRQSIEKSISDKYGAAALNYAKSKLQALAPRERPLGLQETKRFLAARAKEARDSAMGLSGLRRSDNAFDLGQTVGRSRYEKGGTVGPQGTFITVKQKDVGRDPGQLAKLGWTPLDQNALHDRNHPFGQIRSNLVANFNRGDQQATRAALDTMGDMFKTSQAWRDAATNFIALERQQQPPRFPDDRAVLTHILGTLSRDERSAFLDLAAKKQIMANDPKFSDIHMIKGDYAEADITRGKVRISKELAQGKFPKSKEAYKSITNVSHNLGVLKARIAAWGYRTFAAESKRGANEGMVREAVATDLMRLMGRAGGSPTYVTQEVNLIKAQYANGAPKLMLDIRFINREQTAQEFNDPTLAQNARYNDFDGSIVEGRLVDQQWNSQTNQYEPVTDKVAIKKETGLPKEPPDVPRGPDGKPVVPPFKEGTQVEQLGRAKIKMLLLGDRDALGGTGANKGSVGKYMAAIDPGHSLEHGRMTHRINSDFSFEQPSESYHKKFKNFDIFDRAPLSEKMKGIKDIQEMHKQGLDEALFDQYSEDYGQNNPGLDFRDEIAQWKTDYHNKKVALIGDGVQPGVFTERLKVYDFNLSGVPAEQTKRADQVFDLMDNLEKLTSNSDWRTENGMVELNRPRVIDRTEWSVTQRPNRDLVLSATNANGAADKLRAFLGDNHDATVTQAGDQLTITLRPDQLDAFMQTFSNDAIKGAVKARLTA